MAKSETLKNKRVLVTGAGSGIGLSCVESFLNAGAIVYAHFNSNDKELKKIKSKNLHCIQADFSSAASVEKFAKNILKKDTIDVLVNNAGIIKTVDGTLLDLSMEELEETFMINFTSQFILTKFLMKPMMKQKWGRIINISSIGLQYGGSLNSPHYTMAKAAVEGLSKVSAKLGAEHGVLVNAIRVGFTDTKLHSHRSSAQMKVRTEQVPVKRMGKPEEIAETALFLAQGGSFVTGTVLTVAGGE